MAGEQPALHQAVAQSLSLPFSHPSQVSNYTESLMLCDKVRLAGAGQGRRRCATGGGQARQRCSECKAGGPLLFAPSLPLLLTSTPPVVQVCKANRWGTLSLTGDLDARKRQVGRERDMWEWRGCVGRVGEQRRWQAGA